MLKQLDLIYGEFVPRARLHQATDWRPSIDRLGRFFLFCVWKCERGDGYQPASTNLKSCIIERLGPDTVDKSSLST